MSAKKRIQNAFNLLISRKDFNDISITEIIELSNVSRSTFYSHYKTKNEILENVCDDIFDHVFHAHLEKEDHHDFSLDDPNELRHLIIHSFYHF